MDERVVQFRIGLMVLVTLIITAFLLMMFGGHRTLFERFRRKHVFYVQFREAPGVTVDTPVQKSGIRIGRVTEVRLADEVTEAELDPDVGAVVTIEIDGNRRIFKDEVCLIRRSLLGDAVLEFVRARVRGDSGHQGNPGASSQAPPQDPPREIVQPGSWLRGQVQTDPIQLVGNLEQDIANAIKSVADASQEIGDFVEKVSEFLGTKEELGPRRERLDKIMENTLATMERMEALTEHATDVIGDEQVKRDLKVAVAEFPDVLQDVRDTLGRMRGTLDGMDETIGLVNNNLRNIEGFTEPLGEQGGVVIERLDRGAEKLESVIDELYVVARALNRQEGTLGQLIHNPELYENLNRTAANLEDLTGQLRPIVRDARIFSDKIARHPGVIVRDAIRPGAGTKGVPSLSELQRTSPSSRTFSFPRFSPPR